jgi:hypothetical protein
MKREIRGYEMAGPDGTKIRIFGAVLTDEVHTGSESGTVNVTAMWRAIEQGQTGPNPIAICFRTVLIDEGSLRMLQNQDIDQVHLAKITPERAEKPILTIAMPDGTHFLVDGMHRLAWRHQQGLRNFAMYEFATEALERFRVRYRIKPRGSFWRELKPGQVLEKTVGKYPVLNEAGQQIGMRVDPSRTTQNQKEAIT